MFIKKKKKTRPVFQISGVKPFSHMISFRIVQTLQDPGSFQVVLPMRLKEKSVMHFLENFYLKPCSLKMHSREKDYLFRGLITSVKPLWQFSQHSVLVLSGYGQLNYLDKSGYNRAFADKSIRQIASEVLKKYQLKNIDLSKSEGPVLPFCSQYEESDFDFLSRLSCLAGWWCYVDASGQLHMTGSPQGEKALKLHYGPQMPSFSFEASDDPFAELIVKGFDYKEHLPLQEQTSGIEGGAENFYSNWVLQRSKSQHRNHSITLRSNSIGKGMSGKEQANHLQQSQAGQMFTLSGWSNLPLDIGQLVTPVFAANKSKIRNSTERYGEWRVIQVQHFYSYKGMPSCMFTAVPASAKPPMSDAGIQIPHQKDSFEAEVVSNRDEAGLSRVTLRFKFDENKVETPPVRVLYHQSGNGYGIHWPPRPGNNVMVSYNGNIDEAFVEGGFYTAKAKPDNGDASPKKQWIKTPEGISVMLEEESLYVDAPKKIVIKVGTSTLVLEEGKMRINGDETYINCPLPST